MLGGAHPPARFGLETHPGLETRPGLRAPSKPRLEAGRGECITFPGFSGFQGFCRVLRVLGLGGFGFWVLGLGFRV